MSSLFIIISMVDVFTTLAKGSVLSEILHVDDLVLMRESIERFGNNFMVLKTFERDRWKVNLAKTKLMFIGSIITTGCLSVKFAHVRSAT